MTGATLTVDTAVIARNTRLFASLMRGEVMAVVKADGYGAGAELVARAALAAGATQLGVTSIGEGLTLREAGITAPVLSWLNSVEADFGAALHHRIEVAVPSLRHLQAVAAFARSAGVRAAIHLQVDCGLAREGCPPAAWPELVAAAAAAEAEGVVQVVGLMGHLSSADNPADPVNQREIGCYAEALHRLWTVGLYPAHRHLAATAAALTLPSARHSLCRVGAGLVGIDPTGTGALQGALALTAPIIDIREVAAGTPVGYGHTWVTQRPTRLAHIAIGYADGISRALDAAASVSLNGQRLRIVGRVSMDQVVVDLGPTKATLGEQVVVFGPGHSGEPTVDDWASWCGTIANEIVTGIGPRVRRTAVGGAQ
ncbi:MAG: alanine racemase [Promicromonosporaceae bacterium]|nr:alanine racemase [Promicromonosporaceae bacterium]